jgi:ASC-1-like (ASCH) protein
MTDYAYTCKLLTVGLWRYTVGMIELGVSEQSLRQVIDGRKTVEIRLRTSKFVTVRQGDVIRFRKDTWKNGSLVSSVPTEVTATVTQTIFADSFEQALHIDNYKLINPDAQSITDALQQYMQYYSDSQIVENGVVAIWFSVI